MGNTGSCVGRSASSPKSKDGAPSTPHGIPTPPGQPRAMEITEDSIWIEWDKPASDGGAEIFAYIIKMTRAEPGAAWRKLDADCEGQEYTAKKLQPDTPYKFYVQCENDNGVSKPSEISEILTTKSSAPVTTVDENVNVTAGVKEEFGESAEKYVEEDKKSDNKSNTSDKHGSEAEEKKSNKSGSDKKSDGDGDSDDSGKRSSTKSHSDENLATTAISSGVSSDKEFAVKADDDVGRGKFHHNESTRLVYQYSNDSLLDEEEEEVKCYRFNEQNSTPRIQLSTQSMTQTTTYNTSLEQYHTIDNEIPDDHRLAIMDMGYEVDNDYNRLSIISERSMEESVGTPEPQSPAKEGRHFTFVTKHNDTALTTVSGENYKKEVEQTTTKISGVEMSSCLVKNTQTECKPLPETRIPMSGRMESTTRTQSVTEKTSTDIKEVKVVSRLPTMTSSTKSTTDSSKEAPSVRKSSIPEPERKSASNSVETERKSSIPKIPKMAAPVKDTSKPKVVEKVAEKSPSHIPARRSSTGKSGLPTKSSDSSPSTPVRSTGIPSISPVRSIPSSPAASSGIPNPSSTGIPRRGSANSKTTPSETPKSNGSSAPQHSKIPSFGASRSGIPAPKTQVSAHF